MKSKTRLFILLLVLAAGGLYYAWNRHGRPVVLTGIVTTDQLIVSSEVQGRLQRVLVKEGDAVTNGQLLAVIQPREWQADMAFYASSEQQSAAQVSEAESALKFQTAQSSNQILQAQANLASAQAQVLQTEAELEIASLNFKRDNDLLKQGVIAAQAFDQTRTAFDAAKARVESYRKQAQAAQAAVAVAAASQEQTLQRKAALNASTHQLAAVAAQKEKASTRLNYTEIRAPADGVVDVRAALPGEVVNPAQAILTLIDPDNLWIRADVEEGLIEQVKLGDSLPVRLPSGATRPGTVFYRRINADYATQRDVSRTKRDIKTFELRLRCDNRDRTLAVGMTAYVPLQPGQAGTSR